jgi:hypothetical protein
MKCILKIGYTNILLADHKGIEKIVDMLSKGMECRKDYENSTYRNESIIVEREIEIGFELLSPTTKFTVAKELEEKAASIITPKRISARKLIPL